MPVDLPVSISNRLPELPSRVTIRAESIMVDFLVGTPLSSFEEMQEKFIPIAAIAINIRLGTLSFMFNLD